MWCWCLGDIHVELVDGASHSMPVRVTDVRLCRGVPTLLNKSGGWVGAVGGGALGKFSNFSV